MPTPEELEDEASGAEADAADRAAELRRAADAQRAADQANEDAHS